MSDLERPSLAAIVASPGYFDAIVQTAARFAGTNDHATVRSLLKTATDELGADAAYYASFFGDDDTCKSYRSIFVCDPLWASQYADNHWHLDDPWLAYALRHTQPVRTEELPPLTERQRWVVDGAAHFGFASAMVVPVPAAPMRSRTGALCLGSKKAGFFDDSGYPKLRVLARMVAMEIGDWQQRVIRDELIRRARIREEDLVLLRHEQQGHCSKVIAEALGTSYKIIDDRFHRLRQRLGVTSRKAALRLAEIHGLL